MTTSQAILAVDFGTSNSFFTEADRGKSNITPIKFGDGQAGLTSAILYRNGKPPVLGEVAVQTYGMSDAAERQQKGFRFVAQFKPDIVRSEKARQTALDFLRAAMEEAKRCGNPLDTTNRHVYFGVPCEASPEYRETISRIADEAGYGKIDTLHEPLGAVYDCLHHGRVTPKQSLGRILVIDFGGGTCDFALMKKARVEHSWGDMDLGGRLLDDLFFQWFAEQNPDIAAEATKTGEEFYIRTDQCRRIKEAFSDTMSVNRNDTNTGIVTSEAGRGRLKGLAMEEFLRRVRSYRPSKSLLKFYEDSASTIPAPLRAATLNVIDWFERCCSDGLAKCGVSPKEIDLVILAGGSSSWFFVKDYCLNTLGLKEEQIKPSPQPCAAISNGLACYELVQDDFARKKKSLLENEAAFFDSMRPELERKLEGIEENLVARLVSMLFDQTIKPALIEFRERGGKIADMEKQIETLVKTKEPDIKSAIRSEIGINLKAFENTVRHKIADWLRKHGLDPEIELRTKEASLSGSGIQIALPDPVGDVFGAMTVGMVATVAAMILGWSFLTGPIGLIGIVLGVVSAAALIFVDEETAGQWIKNRSLPAAMLKKAITDDSLEQSRKELTASLREQVRNSFKKENKKLFDASHTAISESLREISELSNTKRLFS